jgi:rod shape-determining protein MreC
MENFFTRYKNPLVLMAVLFIQVIALATQVKRQENPKASNSSGTRLIRVWTVTAFTPVERLFVATGHFFRGTWHDYVDLHDVRKKNRELQDEVTRLQMEQVRLREDALQARRLQALLEFRERFVAKTIPAQVIGSSGSEQSRVIYIDKGSHDGIRQDMAVITPDGIVGKVKDVFPISSQVLLINDHDSGAGVILERSRLQGILKGVGMGEVHVMSDEKVDIGEQVVTSGGDQIYPKGMPVGTVTSTDPDRDDPFLTIKLKTAADLNRLEEVLVVIKTAEETPAVSTGPMPTRAADIMAQRLPSVPKHDQTSKKPSDSAPNGPALDTPTGVSGKKKPASPGEQGKVVASDPKAPATVHGPSASPEPTPDAAVIKKPKAKTNPPSAAPHATPETKPVNPEKPPR